MKCVEHCHDAPPCGGSPRYSYTEQFSNKKECCNTLQEAVELLIEKSERELIPKFLRLGFHDCVGGCDGCVDMENADNNELSEPIEAIYPIVERYKNWYSRADVWACATLVSANRSLVVLDNITGSLIEH